MSEKDMAQRIKELRTERGMTLQEVSDIVGVSKSTVRKWEVGMIANMRRDKIFKLAKALGVTPEYLMGWNTKEETKIPTPDERDREIVDMFASLTQAEQKEVLDYIRYILSKRS